MENEEVDAGLETELDDEEIWYSDDPVAVPQINWFAKFKSFSPIVTLLIVTTFFLPNTVGGKISINSGSSIYEFGQGVARAFPCSNSNNLTITPKSQFANVANATGTHYFKSITFAGIPSSCIGVDFIVSAFNNSDSVPLALYNVNNRVAYVSMDPGPVFSPGLNSSGLTVQTNAPVSGFYSFTLTFENPVANAAQVYKVTVQTSTHQIWSCALGGPCAVGDLGPGGGTVFYQNVSGFNCGTLDNSTGSPTGGLCNNLEVAPSGFNSSYGTVTVKTVLSTLYPANTLSQYDNAGLPISSDIGAGLKYTNAITAANATPAVCNAIATCTSAPFIPRLYSSNNLSDWYLPNISEVNQLCKWLYGQTFTSDTTICNPSPYTLSASGIRSGFTWPGPAIIIASNSYGPSDFWSMVLMPTGSSCSNARIGQVTRWTISNANGNGCSGFFPMAIRAF